MRPNYPSSDRRDYKILLIPATGSAERLRSVWADAEQAADFGRTVAKNLFLAGMMVEVVVIQIATDTAVLQRLIEI